MTDRILRMPQLLQATGLGESTIHAKIAAGLFPKPQRIVAGGRAVGWRASTIEQYLNDPEAWVIENTKLASGRTA